MVKERVELIEEHRPVEKEFVVGGWVGRVGLDEGWEEWSVFHWPNWPLAQGTAP